MKFHTQLLTYCLWLLSCYNNSIEQLPQRLQSPQSLRHLLLVPSQKKLLTPGIEDQSNGSQVGIPVFGR